MGIFTSGRAAALALAIAAGATPATAVTVNEGSFSGGDFSGAFGAPTSISNGFDTITGTLGAADRDFLSFTGLATGAQSVTLNLNATGGSLIWSGGFRYSTTPFTSNTSGTSAGNIFMYNFGFFGSSMNQSLSFSLGATFAGTLYVALNLSSGAGASYSLSVPGNAPVAPVPLPATALLLGGAVAGLGALRRKAGRAAA
jgi:hypothetical protein